MIVIIVGAPTADAVRTMAAAMSVTADEVATAIKSVGTAFTELTGTLEELEMAAANARMEMEIERLDAMMEKVEYIDAVELEYNEWAKEGWHTHHKEGKPCKAKVKPPYWHRVRSFCVRSNYH